ncbi:MAG: ATP synthase F1 subunit delta [Cyanobacteria bacterium J06638_38]|uniref:ATP synthase F1 subunit delta n=1 Tax=Xenococcus sp. PCC 7305 TaxID=102125 RepID=UPI0002ACFC49|nr:ATP synthase F1 subunit delta [Xenococcus sp. PCC 7305]ELS04692.1 ATP synthase, F1 delta subunit [Xenococcus sp. PCC 7305]
MSGALLSMGIAEPYAQALMSVAQSQNLTEEFGASFRALESLLEQSQDFRDFVMNPIINEESKKSVLRQVMGNDTNPYLINFLMLLVDKRRIIFLEQIAGQYLELLRNLNQTVLAEVTASQELSESQTQAIIDRVKSMSNARDVEIKTSIDPEIIGGVIIKVGSQVVDASLRGQLRRISINLGS